MASDLMQFFVYEHLAPNLQDVSKPFTEVAEALLLMDEDERVDDGYTLILDLRKRLKSTLPKNGQADVCDAKFSEVEDAVLEQYELKEVLQPLLEAKDCAVRALLYKAP